MSEFTEYDSWWAVPADLFTHTQLSSMDLPRVPTEWARPVAAVTAPGHRRRRERYELYDVAHTVPSPASARVLRSARARHGWDQFVCEDCGTTSERPLSETPFDGRLCPTRRRIVMLRNRQSEVAGMRAAAIEWAVEKVADPALLIVSAFPILPPPTPSGRVGKPVALHVTAAHTDLTTVLDVVVALAEPRSRNLPADAVPADQAWERVRTALEGRPLVLWDRIDAVFALRSAGLDPQTVRDAAFPSSLEDNVFA